MIGHGLQPVRCAPRMAGTALAKWMLPEGRLAALQAALEPMGACWRVRVQLCCDQRRPHPWAPPLSLVLSAVGGIWRSGGSLRVSPGLY